MNNEQIKILLKQKDETKKSMTGATIGLIAGVFLLIFWPTFLFFGFPILLIIVSMIRLVWDKHKIDDIEFKLIGVSTKKLKEISHKVGRETEEKFENKDYFYLGIVLIIIGLIFSVLSVFIRFFFYVGMIGIILLVIGLVCFIKGKQYRNKNSNR